MKGPQSAITPIPGKAPPSNDDLKLHRDSSMQSAMNKGLAMEGEKEEPPDNRAVPGILEDLVSLNIFVMDKDKFADLESDILTMFWLKEYLAKDQKASFKKDKYKGMHLTDECLRTRDSETSSQKNLPRERDQSCKCQEFLFSDLSKGFDGAEFAKILS